MTEFRKTCQMRSQCLGGEERSFNNQTSLRENIRNERMSEMEEKSSMLAGRQPQEMWAFLFCCTGCLS